MKTKLFLTALAIPALFAACSAEEDFTLNNDQPVGGRKVINTDLSFNFVDDAATRLAIGDGAITLDNNDKVAAALIDEAYNNGTTAVNGYYITTGVATNHPFTKSGASWSTPTQLVEGNYLFYYQYNEGLAGNRRAAVPYTISKVQNAFTADAPTVFAGDQAVKDNAMGIGYAYLDADDNGQTAESISVNMYNLFAFLKFNIKTDKTGLEVQQILVKRKQAGTKFDIEGTITNSKVATEGQKNDLSATTASNGHPVNAGILDGSNYSPAAKRYTAYYATPDGSKSVGYMILSMPDVAVNATAQSAYLVIPAADYTNASDAEFEVDVYTNQGVFTREVELSHDENGVRNPKLSELTMGTVQPISLNITGDLKAAGQYFVGTAAQWGKVLRSLPAPANATTPLNIEILNDVELSAADIALIESTQAKNYKINITGENIVLTENCTVSDMKVANMTVKAGAEVVLGKNLIVTTTLTNKGKASVENVAGDTNILPDITTLKNYGEFNVNGVQTKTGATLSIGTIENGNRDNTKADNSAVKLNVNKSLTVTTVLNNYDAKEEANVSTIVVANGATLKTVAATNKGYIENSGMLLADGIFTNTGSKATIDNKETGIISNVNGGTNAVKNLLEAEINAEAGSTTIVADNTGSTITYEDGANVSVTGSGAEKGKIAYVVTASYLTPTANVEYNTIVVDGLNLKLRNAADDNTAGNKLTTFGITNVVLKNGATVDFTLQNAALTLIEVSGSNNKIITATATNGGLTSETLKVNNGGYVLIPLNSYLKLTGDATNIGLQNFGTINVGGKLEYENSARKAKKGTILGTGKVIENTGV